MTGFEREKEILAKFDIPEGDPVEDGSVMDLIDGIPEQRGGEQMMQCDVIRSIGTRAQT